MELWSCIFTTLFIADNSSHERCRPQSAPIGVEEHSNDSSGKHVHETGILQTEVRSKVMRLSIYRILPGAFPSRAKLMTSRSCRLHETRSRPSDSALVTNRTLPPDLPPDTLIICASAKAWTRSSSGDDNVTRFDSPHELARLIEITRPPEDLAVSSRRSEPAFIRQRPLSGPLPASFPRSLRRDVLSRQGSRD